MHHASGVYKLPAPDSVTIAGRNQARDTRANVTRSLRAEFNSRRVAPFSPASTECCMLPDCAAWRRGGRGEKRIGFDSDKFGTHEHQMQQAGSGLQAVCAAFRDS